MAAFLLCGGQTACAGQPAAVDGIPLSQNQYRHPDAAFIDDFIWRNVDLSDLRASGALQAVKQQSDGKIVLRYERCEAIVSSPAADVLRVQVHRVGKEWHWPAMPEIGIRVPISEEQKPNVREMKDSVVISSGKQCLEFSRTAFSLRLLNEKQETLLTWRDLGLADAEHGVKSFSRFELDERDHFFGLGGKTTSLDRRGKVADIYSVKVGDKRGDYGGFALPFFVNPRGYGFILNNPFPRTYFDFGYESKTAWSLTTPDGPLDIFFLAGPSIQQVIKRYHVLTGAPTIPPKWMLGLWVSWLTNASADDWLGFLRRFREERWPADVMVLDLYWRGGMLALSEGGGGANLEWEREKFRDGATVVEELRKMNIHTILHVNTRMFSGKVLEEGLAQGFLRKSSYDQVVGVLENTAARDWNWNLYSPRAAEGVEGWWVDNGERVDGTLSNGLPSRELYGELWNRFLFERMAAAGLKNRLVLARGGWLGTQSNATQWPGDTSPGVERLREDLWFVENLALSGAPFTGVDLGGFNAEGTDKEIMHTDENIIRRVAHGFLLFPIPRLHNHEKAPPKFPWRYSERVQAVYRHYLELRYKLLPYYYSAAVDAAKDSIPLVRPLVFDYAGDPNTFSIDDEVLVGPSLLAAPVMETDAHSRYVYLPAGEWHNYWTGAKVSGGRSVLVEAKLYSREGLPLFVKNGAILVSRPLQQFNGDEPDPELQLEIYPAKSGHCRLWESADAYSEFSYTSSEKTIELTLQNSSNVRRRHTVACRDGRTIVAAETDGAPVSVSDGFVSLELAPGGHARLTAHLNTM
jgi:alpha-glucosidase